MNWSPESLYWHLPHDLRRAAFVLRRPGEFRELQRRRRGTSANFADYREFERQQRLFIHVPKAAGLSVWTAVYGKQLTAHVPLSTYRMVYPKRVFDEMFSFAFVRDPWDRVASAYRFIKAKRFDPLHRGFHDARVAPYPTVDSFVRDSLPRSLSHPLFRSQLHYVGLPGYDCPCVDFLGRYESLGEDFERLAALMGLEDARLDHFHRTTSEPANSHLSRESIATIGEIYERDVKAFGYEPPRPVTRKEGSAARR